MASGHLERGLGTMYPGRGVWDPDILSVEGPPELGEKLNIGARKMTQSIKWPPWKREGLSSISRTGIKAQHRSTHVSPAVGGKDGWIPGVHWQVSQS